MTNINHHFLVVHRLWAARDDGRVEAVIGPYKLYDTSFRSLQGTKWVSDEVRAIFGIFSSFL